MRTLLPAGRWFGIDIRVHISFPMLFVLALVYGAVSGNASRSLGLFAALLVGVVVRDTARALATLYAGFDLRAMFVLPIGGVMAFAPGRDHRAPQSTRGMLAAGPAANVLCGLLLMGACYALVPGIHLAVQPWVSTRYILRSTIWIQFAIAVLGLLPSALTARLLPERKRHDADTSGLAKRGFQFQLNFGAALSLMAMVLGFVLMNPWFIALGGFFFVVSQAQGTSPRTAGGAPPPSLRVRDVMLTDYALLSASDTLSTALQATIRSMGDTFPVLRGDQLVGAITRSTLAQRLAIGGDGYVQGAMTRSFPIASPDETVADAQRRAIAAGSVEFIPVVDDETLVGILTPDSVARAVAIMRPSMAARMDAGRE